MVSGRAAHPDGTEVHPDAWWAALQAAIADAGGLADVSAIAVAGQQHGMVVLDADGRVIRPALLWNDTRSAAAAAALIAEFGAEELARRTGSVPVASFTATKLRWLRDAEPENAARVAAVALPHDWLTWRLRGYGPAGESPLGPVLDELTTDRSDASGTVYWSPATGEYDRELLVAALGHDAVLPRVLGPAEVAGMTGEFPASPPASRSRPEPATTPAPRSGSGAHAGDVVVSIGTSGTVFAVTDAPPPTRPAPSPASPTRAGAFLPLVATLNAARVLDAIAGAARRRPRRARPARARGRARRRRTRAAAVLRGRAHPEPARRDGDPVRHDPRLDHARGPRARRDRGHALRARRRAGCGARRRRRRPPHPADRRRRAEPRRRIHRGPGVRRPGRRARSPASTSPSAPRVQAAWALGGERPGVAHGDRGGARARHRAPRSARHTPAADEARADLLGRCGLRRPLAPLRRELGAPRRDHPGLGHRRRGHRPGRCRAQRTGRPAGAVRDQRGRRAATRTRATTSSPMPRSPTCIAAAGCS